MFPKSKCTPELPKQRLFNYPCRDETLIKGMNGIILVKLSKFGIN